MSRHRPGREPSWPPSRGVPAIAVARCGVARERRCRAARTSVAVAAHSPQIASPGGSACSQEMVDGQHADELGRANLFLRDVRPTALD